MATPLTRGSDGDGDRPLQEKGDAERAQLSFAGMVLRLFNTALFPEWCYSTERKRVSLILIQRVLCEREDVPFPTRIVLGPGVCQFLYVALPVAGHQQVTQIKQ